MLWMLTHFEKKKKISFSFISSSREQIHLFSPPKVEFAAGRAVTPVEGDVVEVVEVK